MSQTPHPAHMGVSQNMGTLFGGGPKTRIIVSRGSILGSPHFRKPLTFHKTQAGTAKPKVVEPCLQQRMMAHAFHTRLVDSGLGQV